LYAPPVPDLSTAAADRSEPAADPDPGRPGRSFRGDIDGLRALAVLLIVAFHAGIPGITGGFIGVDVFFVLSGYLITRNLLEESTRTGGVALLAFWARRIRRLVPALALMVVVTLVLSVLVYSPLDWRAIAQDGAAAALYCSNLLFAKEATHYFGQSLDSSVFLHTWSLGVEEQFYLFWPFAFIVATRLARRRRRLERPVLIGLFGTGLVVSLALSIVLTNHGSPLAFYTLPTRAWEFAAAGLLATVPLPKWLGGSGVRVSLGVAGLAALGWAAVSFSNATPYPGSAALVPVAATLLLLMAGETRGLAAPQGAGATVSRGLSVAPLRWLGRVSYSWYLWHWPFILLAVVALHRDTVPVKVAAAGLALAVAAATYTRYESPVRFSPWLTRSLPRTYAVGALITAAVLVVAGTVAVYTRVELRREPYRTYAVLQASHRVVSCESNRVGPTGIHYCADGDLSASPTVMLVGDSHALQWTAAFRQSARRNHVRLVFRWRSSCPGVPVRVVTRTVAVADPGCVAFQRQTAILMGQLHPIGAVLAESDGYGASIIGPGGQVVGRRQALALWGAAFQKLLLAWQAQHVTPAVIADDPALPFDPILCLARGRSRAGCTPTRSEALATTAPFLQVEQQVQRRLGLTDGFGTIGVICGATTCPIVSHGAYVWSDPNHLTVPFTLTRSGDIDRLLQRLGHPGPAG
jgi:peptidoglycan/LPS O-acetylase OafA/YrhL